MRLRLLPKRCTNVIAANSDGGDADAGRPAAMALGQGASRRRGSGVRQELGVEGGASADVERERQNPLAHGNGREDAIDEVRGRVRHSTTGAARAKAARLARKRDEEIVAARVAVGAREAVIEDAAA